VLSCFRAFVLSIRDLNRTLLLRQHLLERMEMPGLAMVEHLIGLQAQENLPPYLSIAARIDGFEPQKLSDALERLDAVRFLTMRDTIHVLTPDDALALRPWVQPALDQQSRSNQMSRPAREVPVPELIASTRDLLADGPLPVKHLGEGWRTGFPAYRPAPWHTWHANGCPWCRSRPVVCGSGRVVWSTSPSRITSVAL